MPTPPVDLLWPTIIAITAVFTIGAVFVLTIYFGQRRYIKSQQVVLERLQIEVNERQRAEKQYRGIFQNALEGIFQMSATGDLMTANPSLAQIFGYNSPEDLMEGFQSNVSKPLLADFKQKRFHSLLDQRGALTNYVTRAVRKDQKRIWVSVNIRAQRDEDQEILYYEGTVVDITERRQTERLQREISKGILEAQESERKRVAFELHDSINQLLSSVRYRLKSAEEKPGVRINIALKAIQESRSLVEQTIHEVRRISRNLRPRSLDDLGLAAAVRTLSEEFTKRTGITLDVDSSELNRRLPADIELAIFRIVQETLNNVEKHSKATKVQVSLSQDSSDACASIIDNGKGFNAAKHVQTRRSGLGLMSMVDRASLLGGDVTIESIRRSGTKVFVRIPLKSLRLTTSW